MSTATIKSTINLNKHCKERLEYFVQIGEIVSVTEGINIAIERYVKEKQNELYALEMKKAKKDKEFMKRTIGVQKEFEKSDLEIEKSTSMEDFEW